MMLRGRSVVGFGFGFGRERKRKRRGFGGVWRRGRRVGGGRWTFLLGWIEGWGKVWMGDWRLEVMGR